MARDIFWELRIHTNAQTRRKKERPKFLARQISVGNTSQRFMLAIENHPSFLALPVWGMPGILKGIPPSNVFPKVQANLYYHVPPNIRTTLGLNEGEAAAIHVPELAINTAVFARVIAKIVYCQMVAVHGLNGFDRYPLPELILGKYLAVSHLVGGDADTPPAPHERKFVHSVGLHIFAGATGQRFTIGTVRLFGNSGTAEVGMPVYRVVMAAPS